MSIKLYDLINKYYDDILNSTISSKDIYSKFLDNIYNYIDELLSNIKTKYIDNEKNKDLYEVLQTNIIHLLFMKHLLK